MDTDFYELRFKFLVNPLIEDIIQDISDKNKYSDIKIEEIKESNFDFINLIKVEGITYLIASYENKVVSIRYSGSEDLKPFIDELYEDVKAFDKLGE